MDEVGGESEGGEQEGVFLVCYFPASAVEDFVEGIFEAVGFNWVDT